MSVVILDIMLQILQNKVLSRPDFYTLLVKEIYDQFGVLQTEMIKYYSTNTRKCSAEMLIRYKAFFIPNNNFLFSLMGSTIFAPQYGLYKNDKCIFDQRLVIPIYGFDGRVHGFVGYDNGEELTTEEEKQKHIYYLYQSKSNFNKDRYMLITPEEYVDALEKQYICLTDGVFDKFTVNSLGYPAASLLSSRLTKDHIKYLGYIKNWIVLADNDDAGDMLEDYAKYKHNRTVRLKFSGHKDIDEFVNSSEKNKQRFIKAMSEMESMNYLIDWTIK